MTWAVALAYVAAMISAAIMDIWGLRIPNWISISLVVLFLVFCLLAERPVSLVSHLAVGTAVLAATFALFAFGWIGGGDAKLMAAVSVWMGPDQLAAFLAVMALGGAVLGLMLVVTRWQAKHLSTRAFPKKIVRLSQLGIVPYAPAIAFSAIWNFPRLLSN